jgi:HAMP domain-containing protein
MLNWQYAVIATLVCIALVAIFVAMKSQNLLRKQVRRLEDISKRVDALQYKSNIQSEEIHEVRSGALGIGGKVRELIVKFDMLSDKVQEIEYLDPTTRMYTQAAKMVDAGASVEDLMRECELPRAEAELLLSVKKSK